MPVSIGERIFFAMFSTGKKQLEQEASRGLFSKAYASPSASLRMKSVVKMPLMLGY